MKIKKKMTAKIIPFKKNHVIQGQAIPVILAFAVMIMCFIVTLREL